MLGIAALKAEDLATIGETALGAFADAVGAGPRQTYAPDDVTALLVCLCYYVDAEAAPADVLANALEVYGRGGQVGAQALGALLTSLSSRGGDQSREYATV